MPIATQADIEAILGPKRLDDLLEYSADHGGVDAPAEKTARLDAALRAGDNLIAQFLDITDIDNTDPRFEVLRQLAIDEAIYYLQRFSTAGVDEADNAAAQLRRSDLGHMRRRAQMPGTVEKQRHTASKTVSSGSDFALDKLVGLL